MCPESGTSGDGDKTSFFSLPGQSMCPAPRNIYVEMMLVYMMLMYDAYESDDTVFIESTLRFVELFHTHDLNEFSQ